MNDKEAIIAMLDKARIPWEPDDLTNRNLHADGLPAGAASLRVGNGMGTVDEMGARRRQPYDGGYLYFWSEFVFGPDGDLLAVWAWE